MSDEPFPFRSDPRSAFEFLHWQPAYQAAILELDPDKLLRLIKIAEEQITKRLQKMPDGDGYGKERQTIFDAQTFLRSLREETQKRVR